MQRITHLQYRVWIVFIGLFVLTNTDIFAQEKEETVRDSTSTTHSFTKMSLPDPDSIESKYEYDPITDRYKYSEKLGEFSIRYPLYLTPQEFQKLVRKEQMRDYFKEKVNALTGKNVDEEEKRKNLLPIFYVNSGFFETIFGSNEIELIPQGSVEVDLGILFNKTDNPAFSPQNQSNFTLDFDQRISLSLQGNIGTRLSVLANYDTESTFDFQNQLKLGYNPNEDSILQALEIGNVNLPLNSSLIRGAQSLFGVKAQLQFGRTTVTGVFSEQKSDTRSVSVQGGGRVEDFEQFAIDYDENRHYFLAHFFRDNYDRSLAQYPFINSNIQITRVQVWVTNRANNARGFSNARNVVALQDLGESDPENIGMQIAPNTPPSGFLRPGVTPNSLPQNENNQFDPNLIDQAGRGFLNSRIRDINQVDQGFNVPGFNPSQVSDYSRLENARLLTENQYTVNTQLGYVSLNQKLGDNDILAVAFQYTKDGEVFQVGEFANDGVANTSADTTNGEVTPGTDDVDNVSQTQALIVKLLKSNQVNVALPSWDLMMKNIYSLGVFRLSQEDFNLNILYTDPSPVNYLTEVGSQTLVPRNGFGNSPTLLKVLNMDRLNINNDPVNGGDGFFDYFPGLTVDPENGRIIFTTVEPFGEHLFRALSAQPNNFDLEYNPAQRNSWNAEQQEYVFDQLYSNIKIAAREEQADKNKFQLKGRYKTSGQDCISIGAFNVPRGSVTVTAGGRVLQEGIDFSVNYQIGCVEILDQALKESNTPIDISTENNAVFGQQVKRFSGVNVEHKFSEDFVVGGTLINLKERPLTQKSNLNFEPINNTIVGLNTNFSTEVPFLTRMANKLPNVDTEAPSNFSFRGEFAYLFANAPDAADFDGEITSYVDDFEGSQSRISMMSPLSWELSSAPINFGGESGINGLAAGNKRAGLSWYSIDPVFYNNRRPDGITNDDISLASTRRISINEIFGEREIAQNQTRAIFTLDLNYRPNEKGPYNYDTNNSFVTEDRNAKFGGITRALTTTNFEEANIEFLEFWMLNPYVGDSLINDLNDSGKLVFNIGNISEDVLKDGRKQYENGLPAENFPFTGTTNNQQFIEGLGEGGRPIGRIPQNQSLIYAFDTEGGARTIQDAGFDGLKDDQELIAFNAFNVDAEDPSNDNYQSFLQANGGIVERYQRFNGIDGNSFTEVSNDNRGSTTVPTVEDVNRDNTMDDINSYFEYTIDISRNVLNKNNPLISSVVAGNANTPNGNTVPYEWIQFKIPLNNDDLNRSQNSTEKLRTSEGGASNLRSARFMRMFVSGFQEETLLRLGTLDLVRSNYVRYEVTSRDGIDTEGLNVSAEGGVTDPTFFEASSVSIEENPDYKTPPGIVREQLNNNNTILSQDERSLALTVNDLQAQDGRAMFNNFNIDMRQYENLQLFIHAEDLPGQDLLDDKDVSAIIRIGNDFTDNFYQIELPLEVSQGVSQSQLWPENNNFNLSLDLLQRIKARVKSLPTAERQELLFFNENLEQLTKEDVPDLGELKIGIKGNPSFGNVRVLMLGVKNNLIGDDITNNRSVQVWFNEMRLSGLRNQGGWAAVANVDANIADFANITASGRLSTIGFGGVEQGPNERSTDDIKQYDFTTSVQLGQLFPKKWGFQIPVTYSRGEELITPQYDPLDQDLILEDVLDNAGDERDAIEERSTDYTKRQSVSLIGLRKERTGEKKPMPYDVENLSFSTTYNQTDHRDFEIEKSLDQSFNANVTYNYSFVPWNIEPLKKIKFLSKSKHLAFLKDFNFNPFPTNISVNSGLNRRFNSQQFRDVLATPGSIQIPALKQRNFLFDWQYALNYNLTKSLNFNFTSSVNRIVRNYLDDDNNVIDDIGIWDGLTNIGDPNNHNQSLQANYELPFKKFPALAFIKSAYSYTGNFQWQKGSDIFRSLEDPETGEVIPDQGNTIQNSGVHRLNTALDLSKFYKGIGLVKKTSNQKKKKRKKKKKDSLGVKTVKVAPRTIADRRKINSKKLSTKNKIYNTGISIVTMLKRLNINFQNDAGTVLPGYTNDIGFLGTLKPSSGFVFGGQADVRQEAARRGWLTIYDEFNQQYQNRTANQIDVQGTVEPLKNFKIDITANRAKSTTYTENYIVDVIADSQFEYNSLTPNTFGNYSISTILIKTAFQKSNETTSQAFEDFKANRVIIANRLAGPNAPRALDANGNETIYPVGYGPNNQAVLLPAFLAAYSGNSADNISTGSFRDIPLPNWSMKYTGLMKMKWFKKRFKRFSLAHAYRSDFTINRFQSNLEFNANDVGDERFDQGGNIKNELLFGNVNLTEQFSPLLKVDLETKSSVKVSTEIRRDRALSFSFDNSLLTEVKGSEYVIGLGYRVKDITFGTRFGSSSGRRRIIKSDLNLKADLSLRQNETVIRNLEVDNSQVTSGQDIYSLRVTADYALSKNLTALFFYDHSFSQFSVSTAFPQTNIRSGFTLRYNFGN
ncbi:cell surface protein SprA [Aquimarina agarivorans]|uniref:T9SS outer membrane translocon Sov/SprA n=1 Tax=Aquimarina agarivorans TaxID=980584 RepID=UPI000248F56B|nr:cell surface protein SprA [Aquimarina agarivorans]